MSLVGVETGKRAYSELLGCLGVDVLQDRMTVSHDASGWSTPGGAPFPPTPFWDSTHSAMVSGFRPRGLSL